MPSLTTGKTSVVSEPAAEHGEQRWELGYELQELVREYAILRDVIVGLLSEQRIPVELEEYRVLSRHISLGMAEAAARFAEQHEEALHRRASEQLAFMAHELRGQLCVAIMIADGLKLKPNELPAERTAELSQSLVQLSHMLDESIVAERVRTRRGITVANRLELSVDELVAECIERLQLIATTRGVGIRLERGAAKVRGDARLLRSAVSNLLRNAIKFTRAGSTVHVAVRVEGDEACVDIEDFCGGIAPGALDLIFEPFTQAGADRTGFGLGLAIAKQAVEAHGGTITALDQPGQGCRFSVALPVAP